MRAIQDVAPANPRILHFVSLLESHGIVGRLVESCKVIVEIDTCTFQHFLTPHHVVSQHSWCKAHHNASVTTYPLLQSVCDIDFSTINLYLNLLFNEINNFLVVIFNVSLLFVSSTTRTLMLLSWLYCSASFNDLSSLYCMLSAYLATCCRSSFTASISFSSVCILFVSLSVSLSLSNSLPSRVSILCETDSRSESLSFH